MFGRCWTIQLQAPGDVDVDEKKRSEFAIWLHFCMCELLEHIVLANRNIVRFKGGASLIVRKASSGIEKKSTGLAELKLHLLVTYMCLVARRLQLNRPASSSNLVLFSSCVFHVLQGDNAIENVSIRSIPFINITAARYLFMMHF